MAKEDSSFVNYQLIAHRGGITGDKFNEYDPESINQAIIRGYYGIEIDIRMTKDCVLIAHHDPDFKRFFNDDRKVEELTWEEVKSLKPKTGNYRPVDFESMVKLYSGKIKYMIDMKEITPVAFQKLEEIMNRYNLLDGETYFLGRLPREYFMDKAKFTFSIHDIPEMKERVKQGENISKNFYLFGSGTNRMTSSAVKWCQQNSITVIVAINKHNYVYENHWEGAKRDIEYWKSCGVKFFQIDSCYENFFSVRK